MRTILAFACVLLWTAHANAAPAEDALVAYDNFFAAFADPKAGDKVALSQLDPGFACDGV
jgi:hypothetical protein